MMVAVEIRVFHCGQGDTTLLCLDGDKWSLIDCNLTRDDVPWFLGFVDGLGISRLEFVLLTHPDIDHYRGMLDVLKHFSEPSRSIGTFCDGGFDDKLMRGQKKLQALYEFWQKQEEAGNLTYQCPVANHDGRAENTGWPQELLVVSPRLSDMVKGNRRAIARLQALSGKPEDANEYSVVLGLESGEPPQHFCGLLPGDAGADTLRVALGRLPGDSSCGEGFDFIKIAHHGSLPSHEGSPLLDKWRVRGQSVAVVSSGGTSLKTPRRRVLQDYLRAGWRVFDTSRRQGLPVNDLTGVMASRQARCGRYDIKLQWNPDHGLSIGPDLAELREDDLVHYGS